MEQLSGWQERAFDEIWEIYPNGWPMRKMLERVDQEVAALAVGGL